MNLTERLEKLRERRRLEELLRRHPGLQTSLSLDDPVTMVQITRVWEEIGQSDSQPEARCVEEVSPAKLVHMVDAASSPDFFRAPLVVSLCSYKYYRDLPVSSIDLKVVVGMVLDPDVQDLVLYSQATGKFLAITTEEYEYWLFKGTLRDD